MIEAEYKCLLEGIKGFMALVVEFERYIHGE
jgi:hypothetical protein